eukprot:15327699-Heterocapsa_arctica.AAC.1
MSMLRRRRQRHPDADSAPGSPKPPSGSAGQRPAMAPPAQVAVQVVEVPRPRGRRSRPRAGRRSSRHTGPCNYSGSRARSRPLTQIARSSNYAGSRALTRSLTSIARVVLLVVDQAQGAAVVLVAHAASLLAEL